MGQMPKSDCSGPISSSLKSSGHQMIKYFLERFLSTKFPIFLRTGPLQNFLARSAPMGLDFEFDPPLDAPGSVLSSALWFSAVRHTWESIYPRPRKTFFTNLWWEKSHNKATAVQTWSLLWETKLKSNRPREEKPNDYVATTRFFAKNKKKFKWSHEDELWSYYIFTRLIFLEIIQSLRLEQNKMV